MRTFVVACAVFIYAAGASALYEAPLAAGIPAAKQVPGTLPQAKPAHPVTPPADPPASTWKCDGSVRDHRARQCEVRFPPLCDAHLPSTQVTRCAVAGTLPTGCFCTCEVLCDSMGHRQTKPGTIVLGN